MNNSKYLYIIIGVLVAIITVLLVVNYVPKIQESNLYHQTFTGDKSPYEDSYYDEETGMSFRYVPGVTIVKKAASGGFVFELRKESLYNSITLFPDTPPHFNASCFDIQHPVNIRNNTFYVCDVEANNGIVRTYWQKRNKDTKLISIFGEMPAKENSLLVDLGSMAVTN